VEPLPFPKGKAWKAEPLEIAGALIVMLVGELTEATVVPGEKAALSTGILIYIPKVEEMPVTVVRPLVIVQAKVGAIAASSGPSPARVTA
jgi:hypothetical protein